MPSRKIASELVKNSLLVNKASLAERAVYLRLTTRAIAEGIKTGSFSSLFKGQGIEFTGVREYLQGDDVRSIDWNVSARMGKTYVKMFEEEREMQIFLLVDRSLSMNTSSAKRSRLQIASEAAALIALAAEQNKSPIGAVFFDSKIGFSCEPKSGKDRTLLLLNKLDEYSEKTKPGSVLASALKGAAKLLKKRSLVVVLSDFRTSAYEKELAHLAMKHDVIAIRITDSADTKLPAVGTLPFVDPETSLLQMLPTSHRGFQQAWKTYSQVSLERWEALCLKRGVIPLCMSTTDDPIKILTRFFSLRGHAKW